MKDARCVVHARYDGDDAPSVCGTPETSMTLAVGIHNFLSGIKGDSNGIDPEFERPCQRCKNRIEREKLEPQEASRER